MLSTNPNKSRGYQTLFFLAAVSLVFFLYRNTFYSGFCTDFLGYIFLYNDHTFVDVWTNFGQGNLKQFLHFIAFGFYRIFNLNAIAWSVFYLLLHATNGYLVYKVLQEILKKFSIKNEQGIAVVSAVFFLVSPYQIEPVVWKACVHYLITCLLFLLITFNFLKYQEDHSTFRLVGIHISFVLALFALEMSLMIPFFLLLYLLLQWNIRLKLPEIRKLTLQVIVPQFLFIALYFMLYKWVHGIWVGHYGAETHFNADLGFIQANMHKYFAKHLAFVRYFNGDYKFPVFDFIDEHTALFSIVSAIIIAFISYLLWSKSRNKKIRTGIFLLLSFPIFLAPIANLYFVELLYGENDRFGYFASIFLYAFITFLVFQLKPKWRYLLLGIYLAFMIYFNQFTANLWHNAAKVTYSLMEDFRWYDKDEVYILADADNYKGIYMFRMYEHEYAGFEEALELIRQKKYNGEMAEIAQFNMTSPNDSIKAEVTGDSTLKVTFGQWGCWFWREGIGATSYETEDYKMTMIDGGAFNVTFKTGNPNRAIIYQVGGKWKEIKL